MGTDANRDTKVIDMLCVCEGGGGGEVMAGCGAWFELGGRRPRTFLTGGTLNLANSVPRGVGITAISLLVESEAG